MQIVQLPPPADRTAPTPGSIRQITQISDLSSLLRSRSSKVCRALTALKPLKLRFRVGGLDLPERKRCISGRGGEEEEDAQMCPCGKAVENRSHIVGECETYKVKQDVLETRKTNECIMEKFGTLDGSEKAISALGD